MAREYPASTTVDCGAGVSTACARASRSLAAFRIRSDFPDDIFDRFSYDRATGYFHLRNAYHKSKEGLRADTEDRYGYRRIILRRREFLAHRVAWLFVYGVMPSQLVDHINGDRSDNRIENLRLATPKQNVFYKRGILGRSLPKGVCLHTHGRYQAQIGFRGNTHYLGLFDTVEEAEAAYKAAEVSFFGKFARAV